MKNRLFLVSVMIVIALSSAGCGDKGQSPAEPLLEQNDAHSRSLDGILNMIESEVNLSESQKAAFRKLSDELAAEVAKKHAARKAEIEAFATAFKESNLSNADLDKIVPYFFPKEKHELMQSKLMQAHQILNSEQRSKIADKLEARYKLMTEKREKRSERREEMRGIMGGGNAFKKLTRDLDLSDAQKTTLMQIATTFQSKIDDVKAEPIERAQMQAFISEFRKEKMDKAVLNQGMEQLEAKQAEVRLAMKDAIRDVHALLTPEQRAKASEKLLQMAELQTKFDGNPYRHGKR
ncbi:MAG: Spy/CpxP family protein refolding chaperone [Chlorobiales bacterium]